MSGKFKLIKRLMCVFSVLALMTIFGVTNASAGKITMKFSHQNNVYDADQLLAETFKKLVEEKTDGAIKVTISWHADYK